MPKSTTDWKMICIRLTPEIKLAVLQSSNKLGQSMSKFAAEAIRNYLEVLKSQGKI